MFKIFPLKFFIKFLDKIFIKPARQIKFILSFFNLIKIFLFLKIIALIYFLGEEISWGQHFFKWSSQSLFLELNNQEETNLHNILN